MGVYYSCYVLPEPAFMDFSPDVRSLSAIMDLLFEQQWAYRADYYKAAIGDDTGRLTFIHVHEKSRLEDLGRLLGQGRGLTLSMPEVPDETFWPTGARRSDERSRKYDFEDEQGGLFSPRYCDGVQIVHAPFVCSVPADAYSDTPVPCPNCESDVLVDMEASAPEVRGLRGTGVTQIVPDRCGYCDTELGLSTLVAEMRSGITGELVLEVAPFARFMVILNPAPKASPQVYPHPLDERLLEGLMRETGVTFRHVGRWS